MTCMMPSELFECGDVVQDLEVSDLVPGRATSYCQISSYADLSDDHSRVLSLDPTSVGQQAIE